jgi:hypothetical protein
MARKSERDRKSDWIDVITPGKQFAQTVSKTHTVIEPRRLDDLPSFVPPGAKEVALVTILKEELVYALPEIVQALRRLESLDDWSQSFLVAEALSSSRFDWKTSPFRQYKSFKDFYRRELEGILGKWSNLKKTCDDLVGKKITEEQAKIQLGLQNQKIAVRSQETQREAHRPKGETVYNNKEDVHRSLATKGNSNEAAERRLRKDRPDLHARALAGALSWNKAMIEAKFRNKPKSRKQSALQKIQKLIPKLTASERAELKSML